MRLNPLDPRGSVRQELEPRMRFSSWAIMTRRRRGCNGIATILTPQGLRFAAAKHAMADVEQAHNAVARLRQRNSTLVFPNSKRCWALIGLPKTSRNTKGLRRAGLPEWASS